jgi:hypothetical protein
MLETRDEIGYSQEWNRINSFEDDAMKQNFCMYFSKNKPFKAMCKISCGLEGGF